MSDPTTIRYSWGDGQTTLSELAVAETHRYRRPGSYRIGAQTVDGTEFGGTEVQVTPKPLAITALDPVSCPAGPPADVELRVTGDGFAANAQIGFGTKPDLTPNFEPNTVHHDDGTLSIFISRGVFPNPDPAVPVVVGNDPPTGPVSAPVTFAFV